MGERRTADGDYAYHVSECEMLDCAAMAQQIALTADARQTFRTMVGAQGVRVTAWWQPLDEAWYLSLAWLDRRPIVTGVRLTEGGRPLRGFVTDFVGQVHVSGNGEPGREAWGSTHRLLWLTDEEAA